MTIKDEVTKAAGFKPAPLEYLLLTTAPRDATLQAEVRQESWPFQVRLIFWEDISLELSGHQDLLKKHFPAWVAGMVSSDDVMRRVLASTRVDWSYDDSTGVYLFTPDVRMSLRVDRPYHEDRDFGEPWVRRFPNPNGTREEVFIEYDGARIRSASFVSVDGGRYMIPFPMTASDLRISPAQYHLATLLESGAGYSIDDGLRIAQIVVDPQLTTLE